MKCSSLPVLQLLCLLCFWFCLALGMNSMTSQIKILVQNMCCVHKNNYSIFTYSMCVNRVGRYPAPKSSAFFCLNRFCNFFCMFTGSWSLSLLSLFTGQSNEIFYLQFFSSFKPARSTDQLLKIFSILVKFLLRYFSESSRSMILCYVDLPAVWYCA